MPHVETNTRKVIARLEREIWRSLGGASHDIFKHAEKPGRVVIPRHKELSPGVGRSIAKIAGWI